MQLLETGSSTFEVYLSLPLEHTQPRALNVLLLLAYTSRSFNQLVPLMSHLSRWRRLP